MLELANVLKRWTPLCEISEELREKRDKLLAAQVLQAPVSLIRRGVMLRELPVRAHHPLHIGDPT